MKVGRGKEGERVGPGEDKGCKVNKLKIKTIIKNKSRNVMQCNLNITCIFSNISLFVLFYFAHLKNSFKKWGLSA